MKDGRVDYVGDWVKGHRKGHGKTITPGGNIYEGEHRGKPHGEGTLTTKDGQTYSGHFEKGVFVGADKPIFVYGSYEGESKNGLPHGKGKWACVDGESYSGDWVNGLKEGVGKRIAPGQGEYEGEFRKDMPNGRGRMVDILNKFTFDGEFVNGFRHGQGTNIDAEGTFVGTFDEGFKHGKGKLTLPNDDVYQGRWFGNMRRGPFLLSKADGSHLQQIYDDKGTLTDEKPVKAGMKILPGACLYEGDLVNDKPHGKGRMINCLKS